MKVDEIITLEDGKNYGLLLESKQNGFKYFLSVMLNEKEEQINCSLVLFYIF